MTRKSWTVQIVPDRSSGETRTLRITGRAVALAASGLLLLAGLLLFELVGLGLGAWRTAELERVREENRHLTENLREIRGRVAALGTAMDQLAAREQRFRLMAGLPMIDPDVRNVGVGGPPIEDPEREEFYGVAPRTARETYQASFDADRLLRRADLLTASMSQAVDSLRVHREVFLAMPSINPVASDQAWISSSFSRSRYHPILLHNRPHEGIDISTHYGAPIVSAARGTVRFAGTLPGYGKMVEVDHGYGYRTRYAHASRILVRPGQEVERGDLLAEVGQTGLTTGPNLHYEVLVNRRAVDPREYLLGDRLFQ